MQYKHNKSLLFELAVGPLFHQHSSIHDQRAIYVPEQRIIFVYYSQDRTFLKRS
jgi:hypothetical protein